jgi:hypothetical protein
MVELPFAVSQFDFFSLIIFCDLVLVLPIPSELVSVPVFNICQFTVHIHCCTERPYKQFQFIPMETDCGNCAVCHCKQIVAIQNINVMPKSC